MAVLRISRIVACLLLFPATVSDAFAQEAEIAANQDNRITVLELFTAESCPFCPSAERNFNDIILDSGIIGVTCMTDYFDSGTPSLLSRPFCSTRQDVYVHMLKAGARYTPMLVVNGAQQLPGQNLQKVSAAIMAAREADNRPVELEIRLGRAEGTYDVLLPAMNNKTIKYVLRITLTRSAPDLAIVTTADQRRERSPRNVATSLIEGGIWDGKRTVWNIRPPVDGLGDGFVVTVQEQTSGRMTAAGQYTFSE